MKRPWKDKEKNQRKRNDFKWSRKKARLLEQPSHDQDDDDYDFKDAVFELMEEEAMTP